MTERSPMADYMESMRLAAEQRMEIRIAALDAAARSVRYVGSSASMADYEAQELEIIARAKSFEKHLMRRDAE